MQIILGSWIHKNQRSRCHIRTPRSTPFQDSNNLVKGFALAINRSRAGQRRTFKMGMFMAIKFFLRQLFSAPCGAKRAKWSRLTPNYASLQSSPIRSLRMNASRSPQLLFSLQRKQVLREEAAATTCFSHSAAATRPLNDALPFRSALRLMWRFARRALRNSLNERRNRCCQARRFDRPSLRASPT